jgi:hypothetical protein
MRAVQLEKGVAGKGEVMVTNTCEKGRAKAFSILLLPFLLVGVGVSVDRKSGKTGIMKTKQNV